MLSLLLTAALLAEATAEPAPAPPAKSPPLAGTTAPTAPQTKDELVCRKEQIVGSRFTRTVCFNKATWATRTRQDREAIERMQSLSKSFNVP